MRKPSVSTLLKRSIQAVEKCGMSVNTIRIEPDGAIVINGDSVQKPPATVDSEIQAEMVSLQAWREKHGNQNGRNSHG